MPDDLQRLRQVWNQQQVPVIMRNSKSRPRMRLPFADDNRHWIEHGRSTRAVWMRDKKQWEVPKSWFNDLVQRSLDRYGSLYIIQPFVEQEKCAPACMHAKGHVCQCSCMGANHGAGMTSDWLVISDNFAVRYERSMVACRLLRKKIQ